MPNHGHYHGIIDSPLGPLGYEVRDGALCSIGFLAGAVRVRPARDVLGRRIESRLHRYFSDPAISFDLPLTLDGTPFQQRVWRALRAIAPGTTSSYGELARRLHSSPRAVGGACRANPIPIVIPCHRVVAATGLGGYCGMTDARARPLRRKRWLLDHEAAG